MEQVAIERAQIGDAAGLVAALVAAFHHDTALYGVPENGPPGYQSVEVMERKITENEVFTMRQGGQIIGGMVVYDYENDARHLDLLFLHPTHHNRGIGTQAMNFLDQQYPTATRWTLDTPQWAVRNHYFYGKLGYIKTREHAAGDGTVLFAYERVRS